MTRALGIDLGSRTIKIAEIDFNTKSRKILGLYEIPAPADGDITTALQTFFASQGIKGERVAFGLGRIPVLLKRFELPFGDKKRVMPAIMGEFEDQYPIEIDNYLVDARLFARRGRSYEFLAGVCPSADLDLLQKQLEHAALSPSLIAADVEALAQLALHQSLLPASRTTDPYAICDIGFHTTKLAIIQGQEASAFDKKAPASPIEAAILEMRQVGRGTFDVIEWIRERQKIPFEDALNWLNHRAEIKEQGDASGSIGDEMSDEIKLALRPLVVDLYQTVQAFHGRHHRDVSTLYVTGGLSHLKGLLEFLSKELRIPVMAWPTLLGFSSDLVPMVDDQARRFGVALALAHRFTIKEPKGWLNFRRSGLAKKKLVSSFLKTLEAPQVRPVLTGIGIAVAVAMSYGMLNAVLNSRKAEGMQTALIGEFRRLDPELGKKAKTFADDPTKARDTFDKERRKRLAAESTGNSTSRLRARSEVLMEVSESVPAQSSLKEVSIQSEGGMVHIKYQVELLVASSEALKKAQDAITESLGAKSYQQIQAKVRSDRSLEVSAQLGEEEVVYE